jgi:formylglycine-generating enzyme required for sulfatase activity
VGSKGRSQADSKKLVAKKYGVSPKTIHRIWVKRSQYPVEGVTYLEAQKYATTLFE